MKVTITRTMQDDYQTLGELRISNDPFTCKTLELPWLDNQTRISCIPEGSYSVKARTSEKFKDHFHVLDVPGRTLILIHKGNYKKDVKGCILVGAAHIDINSDGHKDVTSSSVTMGRLKAVLPDEFELEITK